ncbi:ADP-ribosyltransferase [Vibrio splendidus]|uniref:ADP-ribosyltransferase n=1 Tax=Vibrio splendidus TaxID=29497 RepID=UPI000C854CCE|nr:ADP-ribosyltransferase [Vibrio splendidus]PMI53418.1 hypothetical protein BCU42_21265 [Vibrio splendidus]
MKKIYRSDFYENVLNEHKKACPDWEAQPIDLNLQLAIRNYTAERFVDINRYLRDENGEENETLERAIALIDAGLGGLPVADTTMTLYRNEDIEADRLTELMELNESGEPYLNLSYMSTSIKEDFSFGYDYFFKIKHIDGRDIAAYSLYKEDEKEVLIPAGSWFAVEGFDGDTKTFSIQQIPEPEGLEEDLDLEAESVCVEDEIKDSDN